MLEAAMKSTVLRLYDWNVRLLRWGAIVAGLATFLIMWVIDINAFSRKLFNAPLPAGVELTQALLPVAIMLPFGWALAARHHVASAFLTSRLPLPARRALHIFWMLVGFVLFAFVTYGTWQYALRSYNMGEQAWGATLRFPIWPSKMAVSLGTLLICVQFALEALRAMVVPVSENLDEVVVHD
jgi:TRAP-type C4-dicarboxylate transport system permease small subunit